MLMGASPPSSLTVSRCAESPGLIPDMHRKAVRFATDRPRFGVTPLGTSHGFDPVGEVTSFVVWINGKGVLVDPSPESLIHLEEMGVAAVDVPYVFLPTCMRTTTVASSRSSWAAVGRRSSPRRWCTGHSSRRCGSSRVTTSRLAGSSAMSPPTRGSRP